MILGGLGVVVVVAVAFMLLGGNEEEIDAPSNQNTMSSSSNLKKKSNLVKKPVPVVASNPRNTARNKKYNMSVLRPLKAKVDMSEWEKIDGYLSEAYKLKGQAADARKAGNEAKYKELMTKAVDTWRKGDMASETFIYEIDGINGDLWEACFKTERTRLKNALKAFRGFTGFESH